MGSPMRNAKTIEIYNLVRIRNEMTCKEICEATGYSSKEVSGLLKKMRGEGNIRIVRTSSHSGNVWRV